MRGNPEVAKAVAGVSLVTTGRADWARALVTLGFYLFNVARWHAELYTYTSEVKFYSRTVVIHILFVGTKFSVNSNLKLLAAVLLSIICTSFSLPTAAQSTGLKLGQEVPGTPKLDLGAAPATTPAAPAQAPAAPAAGVVSNGAWQVSCEEGADCAMAQIGKDKSGTPILEMVVRKLPEPLEADGRTAIAVVDFITPLGVVLTSGLEVKIDTGQGESAPFQICTEQGCLVREPVDQSLIDRFKKGSNANVSVVAANQGDVTAIISLSGFTKSFDSLK